MGTASDMNRVILLLAFGFLASAYAASSSSSTTPASGVATSCRVWDTRVGFGSYTPSFVACTGGKNKCMSFKWKVKLTSNSAWYSTESKGWCVSSSSDCTSMKATVQNSANAYITSTNVFQNGDWQCTTCSTNNCNPYYSDTITLSSSAANAVVIIVVVCVLPLLIVLACCLCGCGLFAAAANKSANHG